MAGRPVKARPHYLFLFVWSREPRSYLKTSHCDFLHAPVKSVEARDYHDQVSGHLHRNRRWLALLDRRVGQLGVVSVSETETGCFGASETVQWRSSCYSARLAQRAF
jgi:hypothetical protein